MERLGLEPGSVELALSTPLLTTQDVLAPWAGDTYSFLPPMSEDSKRLPSRKNEAKYV